MKTTDNLYPELGPVEPDSSPTFGTRHWLLRALWEVASTVLPALFISLFINVFVAQASVIDGPSMQPNLFYDQWVLVEKATYRFVHGPRRGDIVTFHVPAEEEALIKRVVALPGETIEVRGGQVFIDEQLLEEHWTTRLGGPDYPPTVVPPLHVFVLGDNRPNSRDSRYFGPVPVDRIIGRACLICWPPDQFKSVR